MIRVVTIITMKIDNLTLQTNAIVYEENDVPKAKKDTQRALETKAKEIIETLRETVYVQDVDGIDTTTSYYILGDSK